MANELVAIFGQPYINLLAFKKGLTPASAFFSRLILIQGRRRGGGQIKLHRKSIKTR